MAGGSTADALLAAAGLSQSRIEDALAAYFPAAPIWLSPSPASGLAWSRGLVWTVREAQREAHVADSAVRWVPHGRRVRPLK